MVRTLLALAAALVLVMPACGPNTLALRCEDRRVPSDAVPVPPGFEVLESVAVEPEACEAGWSRHAVVRAPAGGDALEEFSTALADEGWIEARCVTNRERCFESGDYFLAAATPADLPPATDSDAGPERYPKPVGDEPQVLVAIGWVVEADR